MTTLWNSQQPKETKRTKRLLLDPVLFGVKYLIPREMHISMESWK